MLEGIVDYLITNKGELNLVKGGTAPEGNVFIGLMPSEPIDCTCLYVAGGSGSDVRGGFDYPQIQLRCRGTSYAEVQDRIIALFNILHGSSVADFDLIKSEHFPLCMGLRNDAWHFSVNFKSFKKRSE